MKANSGKVHNAKSTKPAAKPAAKPVGKASTQAKPKSAVKPAVATPKVKVTSKSSKASNQVPIQPAPKAPGKTQAVPLTKAAVKPLHKSSVKPVAEVPAPKPKKPMPVTTPPVHVPTAPLAVATPAVPAKAGRPSSRLAQLTVPSMAQAVASTAAKASYTQTMPSPVIVPVLPASVKKDPKLCNNWKIKPVAELSDAELMAMPDTEYMNEVQMAAFRLKLVTLKRDILSNAGETTEHLREDTSVTPDPADRATIEEEHALELRTRDRERKLLKKIEQSIARIDAGDYGYCDETGEPIGVGRLLARPTATLSLEAQQRRELKQKMFGD